MTTTFTPNPTFEREFLASRDVRDMVIVKARAVEEQARKLAESDAYRTGHYAKSFYSTALLRDYRWIGRVYNTDFKAWWIEFGTKYAEGETDGRPWVHYPTPARRILGRALDAAGSA